MTTWSVVRLRTVDAVAISELASVLADCVDGGASVGFMQPLEPAVATAFWTSVASAVERGERALLVARDALGIGGTAQLVLALPPNQPHRADLAKVLVHRRARRRGLGAALVRAAEAAARDCGKNLLVLDTVTGGDAQRVYERLGWVRVGDIPRYAIMPTGEYCTTTYYYRDLGDVCAPLDPGGATGSAGDDTAAPIGNRPGCTRRVFCEDALPWLRERAPLAGCSVVTSLPDVSGLPGLTLQAWQEWFVNAAGLVLAATPDEGVSIFYQTDIKRDGTWVDKGQLCQRAAEEQGSALLWHKIVCRRPAGQPNFGRPAFSHLLCFSRGVRDQPSPAYPDVLPATGEMTWSQAMGVAACELSCRYVLSHTATRTVVDPFCGHGTVLAVANQLGLDAVGVELSRKRAQRARNLQRVSAGCTGADTSGAAR